MTISLGGLDFSSYGLILTTAFVLFYLFTLKRASFYFLHKKEIIDIFLLGIPLGILGARLFHVFFSWDYYAKATLKIFMIWEGGLSFYGAILVSGLGILLYCWRQKIRILPIFDLLAVGLPFVQGVGRWGNYFNGEIFPYALYESIFDFSLFIFLFFLEKNLNRQKTLGQGKLFCTYLLFFGIGRFFLERLLLETKNYFFINFNQFISLLLAVFGSLFLFLEKFSKNSPEE